LRLGEYVGHAEGHGKFHEFRRQYGRAHDGNRAHGTVYRLLSTPDGNHHAYRANDVERYPSEDVSVVDSLQNQHQHQSDKYESAVADERAEDIVGMNLLHRGRE